MNSSRLSLRSNQRAVDQSATNQFSSTFKEMTKAKPNTNHLLAENQKKQISTERAAIQARNRKVSVTAINDKMFSETPSLTKNNWSTSKKYLLRDSMAQINHERQQKIEKDRDLVSSQTPLKKIAPINSLDLFHQMTNANQKGHRRNSLYQTDCMTDRKGAELFKHLSLIKPAGREK